MKNRIVKIRVESYKPDWYEILVIRDYGEYTDSKRYTRYSTSGSLKRVQHVADLYAKSCRAYLPVFPEITWRF